MNKGFKSGFIAIAATLVLSVFMMGPLCQAPAPAPAPQPQVAYPPPAPPAPAAEPVELPAVVSDLEEGVLSVRSLTITDNDGNARATIATGGDGMAAISLLDKAGKERAALYLDSSGNPVMYLADASGNAKTQYYLDPNGVATLTYVDGSGNVQTVFPKDTAKPAATPATRPRTTVIVTQPPKETTTQPPDKRETAVVWVLRNFSNYHRRSCPRIKGKQAYSLSVSEARQRGFKPCPECKPMR